MSVIKSRQTDLVPMYVCIVVIMLHSKLYVVRHIQYARCLTYTFSVVCVHIHFVIYV